jgi:release factor H-coupled RctB family protein
MSTFEILFLYLKGFDKGTDPGFLFVYRVESRVMIEHIEKNSIVRIFASDHAWIEGEAIRQLNITATLDGMKIVVGLPDLHPGRGNPVGAAFFSKNMIYPYLIGNDVGCGIALFQTSLKTAKAKRDKWAQRLSNLDSPWDGDIHAWLESCGLTSSGHDSTHGTIGSGNHFAELQIVEKVYCKQDFLDLGLDKKKLFLLVHSGSRGIGEDLLRNHTEKFGSGGLTEGTDEARQYLAAHDFAAQWAKHNRSLIATRFIQQLNSDCETVLDICHNSVQEIEIDGEPGWLHRKGAASSDKGPIVIPGSRGTLSYLVDPMGNQGMNLWSLAHGAGRKWDRKSCKERLRSQIAAKSLSQTELGGVVICDDRDLLFEEAPQAYKNIDKVIHDMQSEGLINVIATLRPLITYKRRKTI